MKKFRRIFCFQNGGIVKIATNCNFRVAISCAGLFSLHIVLCCWIHSGQVQLLSLLRSCRAHGSGSYPGNYWSFDGGDKVGP